MKRYNPLGGRCYNSVILHLFGGSAAVSTQYIFLDDLKESIFVQHAFSCNSTTAFRVDILSGYEKGLVFIVVISALPYLITKGGQTLKAQYLNT